MNGHNVQLGDTLSMRGGEYIYTLRMTTKTQMVLQDAATGRLHVIDRDGTMIEHLTLIDEVN